MFDKLKEVAKKVRQAKFKSVTEGVIMSEALKEVFNTPE
jgi:hypothetical protein